jgi:hypothetical protein
LIETSWLYQEKVFLLIRVFTLLKANIFRQWILDQRLTHSNDRFKERVLKVCGVQTTAVAATSSSHNTLLRHNEGRASRSGGLSFRDAGFEVQSQQNGVLVRLE